MNAGEIKLQRTDGFTLIEMLLAVTLMAAILALVYGGMQATTRATLRGEMLISATQSMRMTHQFVSRQIHQMLPMHWDGEGEEAQMFLGDVGSITWIGPMPGYLGFGGPQLQRLEVGNGEKGRELHFRHAILVDGKSELEAQDPIVLLENVDNLQFEFLKSDEEEKSASWQAEWEEAGALPLAVRLSLEFTDTGINLVWPDLVASSYNSRISGGNRGGRDRYQRAIQDLIQKRNDSRGNN
ncbi:MAG: prepilin-type N-terminal cleavage/methylation domain-containing protein [Xanthomonadales bacterium]|nr:prepilin-type N-terminal cleavage/methylation domain-containing protein [Xanthomonadales bacterium]